MEFRVDEAALDDAAAALSRLGRDVSPATAYAGRHLRLDGLGDSGMFVTAIGTLDEVRTAVEAELAHLHTLMTTSADELRATARQYRRTDDAREAALDRLYNGVPGRPEPV